MAPSNIFQQLISDGATIDRKIKYRVPPKANIALKILRGHLANILAQQFRGKPLTGSQTRWNEVALMVLGKQKLPEDEENLDKKASIAIVQ